MTPVEQIAPPAITPPEADPTGLDNAMQQLSTVLTQTPAQDSAANQQ